MKIGKFDLEFDQESSDTQKCLDIWKDVNYMKLFTRRNINSSVFDSAKKDSTKHKVMKYNWHNDVLMFHNLVVFRLEE
jgi:hypothetical protein